jgi:hypothetical protein
MNALVTRLLLATFAVGLLGFGSGCIVRAEGHSHGHVRYHDHGRRSYYHCHESRGRHRQRVCHDVRHGRY